MNRYLGNFLWNCPHLNDIIPHWKVNIGSGNGLVQSGNKPLPELMSTQFSVITRPQWVSIGLLYCPFFNMMVTLFIMAVISFIKNVTSINDCYIVQSWFLQSSIKLCSHMCGADTGRRGGKHRQTWRLKLGFNRNHYMCSHICSHGAETEGSKMHSARNGSNTQFSVSASKPYAPILLLPSQIWHWDLLKSFHHSTAYVWTCSR